MNYLLEPLLEMEEYNGVLKQLNTSKPLNESSELIVAGPSDSQKAHLIYGICTHLNRKALFITFNEMQARRFYEDFTFFLDEKAILFPAKETVYYDVEAKSNDAIYKRIVAIDKIIQGDYSIIITSIDAISNKLVSKQLFTNHILEFSVGSVINTQQLIENFTVMGYERADMVEGKGQFAVRGGIIDIFTVDKDEPIRIELFGDEIDSIRTFDAFSQRSITRLEQVRILPAKEVICPTSARSGILAKIKKDLNNYINKIKGKKDAEFIKQVRTSIAYDIERFESSFYFDIFDFHSKTPFFHA